MKRYTTNTEDTCWRDCLACILEVNPVKVPNFVKLYKADYMSRTRAWLDETYNKGLVYIPAKNFMETGALTFNSPVGPSGYSMGYMTMVDKECSHVVICFNGGVLYDNGEDGERNQEYDTIKGYFVLYDLESPKVRAIRKKSIKKNSRCFFS